MRAFKPLLLCSAICSVLTAQAANKVVRVLEPGIYSASLAPVEPDAPVSNATVYNIANSAAALESATGFEYSAERGGFASIYEHSTTAGALSNSTQLSNASYSLSTRLSHNIPDEEIQNLTRIDALLTGYFYTADLDESVGMASLVVEYTSGLVRSVIMYRDNWGSTANGFRSMKNNDIEVHGANTKIGYKEVPVYFEVPADYHGTVKDVWIHGSVLSTHTNGRIGFKDISLTIDDAPTTDGALLADAAEISYMLDSDASMVSFAPHYSYLLGNGGLYPTHSTTTNTIPLTHSDLVTSTTGVPINHGLDVAQMIRVETSITAQYGPNNKGLLGIIAEFNDNTIDRAIYLRDNRGASAGFNQVYNNAIESIGVTTNYAQDYFHYDITSDKRAKLTDIWIHGNRVDGYAQLPQLGMDFLTITIDPSL